VLARRREIYAMNAESFREKSKAWARANPEKARAAARAWFVANINTAHANSKAWREKHLDELREKHRAWHINNPGQTRALRTTGHAKRKQRLSVVICERVDPFEIFERDRWTCRLCGVKTPGKLRGTHEPSAPVLDHIIPLALGGPHTRTNLQCLCYKCNATKAAKYEGQLAFM
jgi:5-methylcytosine-specific restriction endonuclease McrA